MLPNSIIEFLQRKNRPELIQKAREINTISCGQFFVIFKQTNAKMLSTGFNGTVYLDESKNDVYKFSHLIRASDGKALLNISQRVVESMAAIKARWADALNDEHFSSADVHALLGDVPSVGVSPPIIEVYGALLWSVYCEDTVDLPDMISDDGLSYRRKFIEGPSLKHVIDAKNSEYSLPVLFKKLVHLQRRSEAMLFECGFTIDLANPANMIIDQNGALALIDLEPMYPNADALRHYEVNHGRKIPSSVFKDLKFYVQWPLMPEHIVMSKTWNLNFKQATQYMQAFHDCTEREAITRLAQLPDWNFDLAPFIKDRSNVIRAQQLL